MQPFVEPDYLPALPELFLAGASVTLLMAGVFIGDRSTRLMTWLACVAMAAAFVMVLVLPDERTTTFFGLFVVDRFAAFMKCLVLVGAAVTLIVGLGYVKREGMNRFEFPVLIVFATLGMLLMISANDLIALYVGLELQSLSLYIVAAFRRDSLRSTEAGLKYFVLGAISSGLLLYGCSMVYGFTGVTGFEGIAEALATTVPGNVAAETGVLIGLVFIAAALAFKVSAVPFHMWTPDVYEGAPTPVTAFFAAAPKVAAMALLLRVFLGPFHELAGQWDQIVIFVSIASMGLGAFAAIGQKNIKRLMAYSSIGHVGYALVGAFGGNARRHPGRARLHADLHGDDARRLRLHPRHAPARPDGGGDQRPLRPLQDQPGAGVGARHLHVLDGGHPAARRLLRQALRVPGCSRRGALWARRLRRAGERRRRLLLHQDRESDVLRRAGGGIRPTGRPGAFRRACGHGHRHAPLLRLPGAKFWPARKPLPRRSCPERVRRHHAHAAGDTAAGLRSDRPRRSRQH